MDLSIINNRQVCAALIGAKNLAKTEPLRSGLAGATTLSDAKNEFAEQLRRDGYNHNTIKACLYYLDLMERKGVNVLNPEQIKGFIASQKWQNHSKATAVVYYGIFAKAMHIQWNPPRYRYEQKVPFVPMEKEVNDLIAGCGRKMSVFLRLLAETGMRAGEALRLSWQDFDFEKSTVAVNNPEKGSLPRILPISLTLKTMVNSLPKNGNLVFGRSMNTMQSNFRRQRNRLAEKLKNTRLKQISFHTLRHFFATMLYAKTLNIIKVQQSLGHKNLNNTQIYTHLIAFKAEEYEVQIAETAEEAKKFGEAGFEHYDTIDRQHLYRRRK
jgi:integrase